MKTNDLKTLGLVALGAAVIILRRIRNVSGVGKVERIKRRIYKEVSLAQQAGVDFSKKYPELSTEELDALRELGEQMGWKQSKRAMESGKPYTESYYSSLRRAWNAVSGLDGAIGKAYTVRDANGNTVLTWIEDAAAHVEAEKRLQELDRKLAAQRRAAKRRQREMQNIVLNPAPNFQDEADEVEYIIQQEAKKPSKRELRDAEYAERQLFAEEFLTDYTSQDGHEHFGKYLKQTDPNGTPIYTLLVDTFSKGKLKVNDKGGKIDVYLIGHGWVENASPLFVIASDLLKAWKTHGLRSDNLDEIRKQLLDRAKFMAVSDDGSFSGAPIQGDERYNYLDKINWIVVFYDYYKNGERTIYPYRAFEEEWHANMFANTYKSRKNNNGLGFNRQVKVMPITELDFNTISGTQVAFI